MEPVNKFVKRPFKTTLDNTLELSILRFSHTTTNNPKYRKTKTQKKLREKGDEAVMTINLPQENEMVG